MTGRILTATIDKSTFGSKATQQVAVNPSTGVAVFGNLIFNDTASRARLTVSDGVLSAASDSFNIYQPAWYRSAKTGDWDSISTWEYSNDTGNTWRHLLEILYALKHGKITIRNGHIITMRIKCRFTHTG